MVYIGSRKAKSACAAQIPAFCFFGSCVMTAPLFISEPVPNTVMIVPSGMNSVG